jgi:hypothetical protein
VQLVRLTAVLLNLQTHSTGPDDGQDFDQAEASLRVVYDQMQTYYDERSEEWLESEKAEAFSERMEAIKELTDQVAVCASLFKSQKENVRTTEKR